MYKVILLTYLDTKFLEITRGQMNPTVHIQKILSLIATDSEETIDAILHLPLEGLPQDYSNNLVALFLRQAHKCASKEACVGIICAFEIGRAKVSVLPAITGIFLNRNLTRDIISFVLLCHQDRPAMSYFVDLINMGDDNTALALGMNMEPFFELTSGDWKELFSLTNDFEDEKYENQKLRAFFLNKIAKSQPTTKRPEWVIDCEPGNLVAQLPPLPTPMEATKEILSDFVICGIQGDTQKLEEAISIQYSMGSITQKIGMISRFKKVELFDDTDWFLEYGPLNTIYHASNPEPTHVCHRYGGCRMLLCCEYENKGDDGESVDIFSKRRGSWFRGECDICQNKIEKSCCAVRLPLQKGGWYGCYCSFECVREQTEDKKELQLISIAEDQIYTIGIRYRD